MASETFEAAGGWRRRGWYAVPAALVLLAAWAIWTFAHQQGTVRREAAFISTIIPVQEPPPPPPPPTRPPEPKPIDEPVPQPTPQQPQPAPQTPSPAQPTVGQNAVTENGPPQAGSDAFNIGAGDGSGGRGAGIGGGGYFETAGTYGQYAKAVMVRAVRASPVLKGKELRAEVKVWFDARGKAARVDISKGSGTGAYDTEIRRVLLALEGLRPPAASVLGQMPIIFIIDERRPL